MLPGKQRDQRDRLQMRFAELAAAFIALGWSAKQLSCVLVNWKEVGDGLVAS